MNIDNNKVYKLIKRIDSPHFTRILEAGRIYTGNQLKILGFDNHTPRLDEFVEECADLELKNCRIVPKSKKDKA